MKKVIKGELSVEGIKDIQRQLEEYKKQLQSNTLKLAERLADVGIVTAKSNVGNFGKYIIFSKRIEFSEGGCKVIMYARNESEIISQWKTSDGIKTARVSPLLMAEFGSGKRAKNPKGINGVGQGTFPGQTHAFFDEEGWYWQDLDDVWHHSYGITPTMPMYNASLEMIRSIESVAREIFDN